jgi:hypothetical protein
MFFCFPFIKFILIKNLLVQHVKLSRSVAEPYDFLPDLYIVTLKYCTVKVIVLLKSIFELIFMHQQSLERLHIYRRPEVTT